jgi:hypothetical protein
MAPKTIVAIPGMPGESIDRRILPDVEWLIREYKLKVSDGYSTSGVHESSGDHPKGAGVDFVPDFAHGGSWALVASAAAYARTHPDTFRWIGWNGTAGHGDPAHAGANAHLHLSWHGYGTAGDTKPVHLAHADGGKSLPGQVVDTLGGWLTGNPLTGGPNAKDAGNAAADAANAAATATGKAIAGLLVDAIGKDGARVLLSVGLVAGAVAAIAFGTARALGLRTPPIGPLAAVNAVKGGK